LEQQVDDCKYFISSHDLFVDVVVRGVSHLTTYYFESDNIY